jgi:C-terminal processing protease CtpA/Prc
MKIILAAVAALSFAAAPSWADVAPPYPEFDAGFQVEDAAPYPKINNVVKGSPAAKAGLKNGDYVIALDGRYSKWKGPFYFWAKALRGPKDSKLRAVVLRGDSDVLVIDMPRTVSAR